MHDPNSCGPVIAMSLPFVGNLSDPKKTRPDKVELIESVQISVSCVEFIANVESLRNSDLVEEVRNGRGEVK